MTAQRRAKLALIGAACATCIGWVVFAALSEARTRPERGPRANIAATGPAERGVLAGTMPSTGPTSGPTTAANATSGPAGTNPSSKPTDAALDIAPTPPFPQEFSLLLKRSAFMRGPASDKGPGDKGPKAGGPEANFGLRGVGEQDGVFTALIEDINAKSTQRLKTGEKIATGSIKSITIDGIVYEGTGGKTQQVTIGQNLAGAPLPPQPPPPPKPPEQPNPNAQPGQPGGPPQPGQPGGPPMPVRGRRG
jgi:hypothetical protein